MDKNKHQKFLKIYSILCVIVVSYTIVKFYNELVGCNHKFEYIAYKDSYRCNKCDMEKKKTKTIETTYNHNEVNRFSKNYSSEDWERYYKYHKYIGLSKGNVIKSMGKNYSEYNNKLVYSDGTITAGLTLSIRITFEFKNGKVFRITYYDQSRDKGMPTYIE